MRIRIQPLLIVYALIIAACASWQVLLGTFAALAIHEAGHCLAGKLAGETLRSVELTPFGGVITYGGSPRKGWPGFAVAAAGPLSNYLAMLLAPSASCVLGTELTRAFVQANLAMLCINLLPALPLDGGRMVFSIGYYLLPVSALITVLTRLGIAAGALMLGMAGYGLYMLGQLNGSLVIVGVYLMLCAARSRHVMLAENLYAVVQERCGRQDEVRRVHLFRVPAQTPLYALLDPMERTTACAFVYEDETGEHVVGERQLCLALLRNPTEAIAYAGCAQATD
ncbi:MAG: hypothetical protein ACI4PG_02730, partial [Candidatus Ventricola sp.]